MTNLDSRAEETESQRDMGCWQTGGAETARESQAMQQPEGERHQPWLLLRQTCRMRILANNFPGDKQNAKRDDRFHRRGRHVNKSQGCESQRHCV